MDPGQSVTPSGPALSHYLLVLLQPGSRRAKPLAACQPAVIVCSLTLAGSRLQFAACESADSWMRWTLSVLPVDIPVDCRRRTELANSPDRSAQNHVEVPQRLFSFPERAWILLKMQGSS